MSEGPLDKAEVIEAVCLALDEKGADGAAAAVRREWAFKPGSAVKRLYGTRESVRVFMRDGFLDRYSGERLVFPPVLRVISLVAPVDFPYHPAWKTGETHPAFNELSATIDHVIPVTRGGEDVEANWVTTSMARSFAKMNSTPEEMGWSLHPPGRLDRWAGMMYWFIGYATMQPQLLENVSIDRWYRAARLALEERQLRR